MLRLVDAGQIELRDLAALLDEQDAFVRAAMLRAGDAWVLWTCDAIVGAEPPDWRQESWVYPSHAFVAGVIPVRSLISAFGAAEAGELAIGPLKVSVPPTYSDAQWRHLPSRALYGSGSLPWPTVDYEINGPATPAAQPSRFLIAEGCPSFTDAATALRAFFYGDYSTFGAGWSVSRIALIRSVDTQARVKRVVIGPAHLDVVLGGESLAGVQVELSSGQLRSRKTSGPRGRLRFRLPHGLPDDAWLFVTRGTRWLDYRPLGPQLPGSKVLEDRGVEYVIPDDPDSKASGVIARGEGPHVEFKRDLLAIDGDSRRKVLKTVAAFANAGGGVIVFGVDRDEVTVVGIPTEDEQRQRDRLGEIIHAVLRPVPEFEILWATAAGVRILMLEVAAGLTRPYGIQLPGDGHVQYYVRRGASTFPATQQDVREATLESAVP